MDGKALLLFFQYRSIQLTCPWQTLGSRAGELRSKSNEGNREKLRRKILLTLIRFRFLQRQSWKRIHKCLVSPLNVNICQYFYFKVGVEFSFQVSFGTAIYTNQIFIWVHHKKSSYRLSSLNFSVRLRDAEIDGERNQSQSQAARLRRDLFNTDYDPELRPVLNMSDKVTVKLGISLHQLIDVVRITYT